MVNETVQYAPTQAVTVQSYDWEGNPTVQTHPPRELIDDHWEIHVDGKWYTFLPFMALPEGRYKYRHVQTFAEEVWVR